MKGSIQKKGKTYYAVLALNGKRRWFKGGKRKDAERILVEKLSEISQGTYREIPKTTFKDFANLWMKNHAENNLKPSTIAGYKHVIDKRLMPNFEHFFMADISPAAIQAYVSKRKQGLYSKEKIKVSEGEPAKEPVMKKISAKTISNEIVIIKEMFKHAHRWGYIKQNPAEHLERPKIDKPEIEILQPDEFKKLLEKSGSLYMTAFLTSILTGVRAGELWGLQWGDMDWHSKRLYVRRSVWKNAYQTPKSKNSIRNIDLPDNLVFELKKWKLACPISGDDLMFPSIEGQITCHENAIKRHFNPALRKAELRHVSFHSLRHTNASLRIRAEQNIKYMSMQMGHSSVKITLDTYGHLFNDAEFNRQQVDLLQTTFQSVRKPLENTPPNAEKGLASTANPL
jgi:integrase